MSFSELLLRGGESRVRPFHSLDIPSRRTQMQTVEGSRVCLVGSPFPVGSSLRVGGPGHAWTMDTV